MLPTGVASENGNIAEDSETIPDQTPVEGSDAKPDSEPDAAAAAATSGDGNDASPLAGADSQPSADITPVQAPAETPAAETPETATSSSEAAAPEQGVSELETTDIYMGIN